MLKKIITKIGGDPNKKKIEEYVSVISQINDLEAAVVSLSDEELKAKTPEFKSRLDQGETLDDLLAEAFAVVREVSKRTLGMRHFDTQLLGGMILHAGKVAEMRTGEGKTLMATLPLYLNALTGLGVHLITVNDYLARRDARWMSPIFNFLGLSVGVLQMGSRTEGGKKAYIVNLENDHPQEDQHQMDMVDRKDAYLSDIVYGTNNEFGFDYLRDNMRFSLGERSQRGHKYAIIDEVDNVLIDEARTPLIISGPSHDDAENYLRMAQVVKRLQPSDYEISEKDRTVNLSELGETKVEQLLGVTLRDPERPEDVTPEQARLLGFLEQALRAQFLFKRNKDYLVQGGQIIIIDVFTGRLMPGRRWSDGLHQAVEAKEAVRVQSENITHATITIQNYFRMYNKLSGMTGTALTEAEEFDNIYALDVLDIPPIVEYNTMGEEASLKSHKQKDEYGYEYTFYSQISDPENNAFYFKRKDYPDVIFRTEEAKFRAIIKEVIKYSVIGRPILIGTTSVEASEKLSSRLRTDLVRKLAQVLLLRSEWFLKNDRFEDGRLVLELKFLNEPLKAINTQEINKLAKSLGVNLSIDLPENVDKLIKVFALMPEHRNRFINVLKKGISHQVLNARKHTEESQIIAGAGAFGAVTIATNMAGRGVDIKLGGEIAEEILSAVNRVLKRVGVKAAYDVSMEERLKLVNDLKPEDYGIYEAEIKFFIDSMEGMSKVKSLGGLHVIGSERHEARRIDNQLRGRAARLGDPGSSRFYLSLEDELMRIFGGQQVDSMMQRLGVDEAVPLEHGIVSRVIESSQTRVEGANFDSRKHLLEYDDVLNAQRVIIYGQRDHILQKEDLTEDVREMLEMEIQRRVPLANEDEDGAWKLLGWLEQIQPTMIIGNIVFPSYTFKLLIDSFDENDRKNAENILGKMLKIAEGAISNEEEHVLDSAAASISSIQLRNEIQLDERMEILDTFFEALRYEDETEKRSQKEVLNELVASLAVPINLSNTQARLLDDDPDQAREIITTQIEDNFKKNSVLRIIGAVERRLKQSLDLVPNDIASQGWDEISNEILSSISAIFKDRKARLLGSDGLLAKDIKPALNKLEGAANDAALVQFLMMLPRGEVTAFDKRTHKQIRRRTTRLTYIYHAAELMNISDSEELSSNILAHLDKAQDVLKSVWGTVVFDQFKDRKITQFDTKVKAIIDAELGESQAAKISGSPISELSQEEKKVVINALGQQGVTETYRRVIMRVISELWIEYLTQMEALRISIGLEAYAQRDPLAQYKLRATEYFQQLFQDMRTSVVTRMFTFRPNQKAMQQQAQTIVPEIKSGGKGELPVSTQQSGTAPHSKGKRKRKRKR
jgi:preprotein translocase subunit SecA